MSSFPPRCYYCDSKDFGLVDGYERYIVTSINVMETILR